MAGRCSAETYARSPSPRPCRSRTLRMARSTTHWRTLAGSPVSLPLSWETSDAREHRAQPVAARHLRACGMGTASRADQGRRADLPADPDPLVAALADRRLCGRRCVAVLHLDDH